MNAIDLLTAQHQELLELSNALTGAAGDPRGTPKGRNRTAQRLVMAGSRHEAIEEQWFWPAVRELDGGAPLALAGLEQEQTLRNLLDEIDHMKAGNVRFTTAIFVAASRIRDHVTYEESQILPKLQLAVSEEDLERIGTRLQVAWHLAPTRPHPKTPADARLLKSVGPPIAAVDRALDALTGRGR